MQDFDIEKSIENIQQTGENFCQLMSSISAPIKKFDVLLKDKSVYKTEFSMRLFKDEEDQIIYSLHIMKDTEKKCWSLIVEIDNSFLTGNIVKKRVIDCNIEEKAKLIKYLPNFFEKYHEKLKDKLKNYEQVLR